MGGQVTEGAEENPMARDDEISSDRARSTVALSTSEIVGRYGSANAEFVKGYTGMDHEAGRRLSKGLAGISRERTSAEHKAGWAAEVHTTSRRNAEAIIAKSDVRTVRSDDMRDLGLDRGTRYRQVVDVLQVDGQGRIIEGSEAQMKFEANGNAVVRRVTSTTDDYSKYFGKKIALPSDQVETARNFCRERAKKALEHADRQAAEGNLELAEKLRDRAAKFEKLANEDIVDAGLTKQQATVIAVDPVRQTVGDILKVSHRAGIEGAKVGVVIGGSVSLITQIISVGRGDRALDGGVIKDVAVDAISGGVMAYAAAAAGAATKGLMQQSGNSYVRTLSATNAPALAINVCVSLASSVKRYVRGEIDGGGFLEEVGEKGAGMLSSGMFAAAGAVVMPLPFLGAAIGGFMGYTLASMFYQAAMEAGRERNLALTRLAHVRAIEEEARRCIAERQAQLADFIDRELPELRSETEELFATINTIDTGIDEFATAINRYAELLGTRIEFGTLAEFDEFMAKEEPLRL